MALIGVHHIHNVLMSVAVIFDLGLMLAHDFRDLGKVIGLTCAFDDSTIPTAEAIVIAKRRNVIACRFICPFPQVSAHLFCPPGEGYCSLMTKHTQHATHPDVIKRLKRANGHLLSVIGMIESERPCNDIAQQLHAVEKAITQAKRTLIHDHIDHCLDAALIGTDSDETPATAEFKAITKFL